MELATGILQLAEIAKQNGGTLPADLAQYISQHREAETQPNRTNDITQKMIDQIVNKALWT